MGRVWTRQPPAGTRIDWSNPLTNGLVVYTFANASQGPVVFGRAGRPMQINTLTAGTYTGTFGSSAYGKGFDDLTFAFLDERPTYLGVSEITECSIVWVGSIADTGTDRGLAMLTQNSSDFWYQHGFALIKDTAVSGTARTEAFRFRVSTAVQSNYESVDLDLSASVGSHVVAATLDLPNETGDMYVDGKGGASYLRNGVAIDSKPIGTDGTNFDSLVLNSDGADSIPNTGVTNAVFWWNRKLTPAELKSLSIDPWQIFEPPLNFAFADVPDDKHLVYVDRPWTEQPPSPMQFSRTNKYGKHLRAVIVPGWYEATDGGAGAASGQVTAYGPGFHKVMPIQNAGSPDSSSTITKKNVPYKDGRIVRVIEGKHQAYTIGHYFVNGDADLGIHLGNEFTLMAIHKPIGTGDPSGTGSSDPRIFSKDTGFHEEDHDLMIGYITSTNTCARTRVRLGTTTRTLALPDTGANDIDEDNWNLVAASLRDEGTNTRVRIYQLSNAGGYQTNTGAWSGKYNPRTSTSFGIFNTVGNTTEDENLYDGSILCVYFFDTVIGFESDLRSLFDNPWQVFDRKPLLVSYAEALPPVGKIEVPW